MIPNIIVASNETILSQILDANDQVIRIGSTQKSTRNNNQN